MITNTNGQTTTSKQHSKQSLSTTISSNNKFNNSPVMTTLATTLLLAVSCLFVGVTSQQQQQFDVSNYKEAHSAVKAHPRLREFAKLLELDGVRPLVATDQTELTIFAPVDEAMEDLIQKAKSRSFNLVDVAKHHIVGEAVFADENIRYPHSVLSYTRSSPLFLTQPQYQEEGLYRYSTGSGSGRGAPQAPVFVNNAKIVETYVFQNGEGALQALHVIDHVLERLSITQRTSIRTQNVQAAPAYSAQGSGGYSGAAQSAALISSPVAGGQKPTSGSGVDQAGTDQAGSQGPIPKWKTEYKQAQIKKPISLDNVLANQQVLYEFYEKYSDLTSQDSLHTRAYVDGQAGSLDREHFDLERLIRALHQHPQLNGLLYNSSMGSSQPEGASQTNATSHQYSTYFLPMPATTSTGKLFDEDFAKSLAVIRAHVIPNEVLFTRTMGLGRGHSSMSGGEVSLSLAKTVPYALANQERTRSSPLATPLLVQSSYYPVAGGPITSVQQQLGASLPKGIVSSEIVVANIPLTSGVLHLIRKPLVVSDVSLVDYLHDQDQQLSHIMAASGTATRGAAPGNLVVPEGSVPRISKFRGLLSKDYQLFAELTSATPKTVLVPSDEAFQSIRYDLRALINPEDEQQAHLIPQSWDSAQRANIVSRLLKKHIIMHHTVTTGDIHHQQSLSSSSGDSQTLYYNLNGKQVEFFAQPRAASPDGGVEAGDVSETVRFQYSVGCEVTRANLLHYNLAGINGVVHIIDRVLGEEPETVYSLLKSIVLRYQQQQPGETMANQGINNEIGQLIETNMNNNKQQQLMQQQQQQQQQQLGGRLSKDQLMLVKSDGQSGVDGHQPSNHLEQQNQHQVEMENPKLLVIAESIRQYLEDSQNAKQLEQLAQSVNISYQLAKSSKDGADDWNERFKQQDKLFTYFVPSDLAWLRLQQRQPRLYQPLMSALEELGQATARSHQREQQQRDQQQQVDSGATVAPLAAESESSGAGRASESSQRLRQILERHVVVNRKITKKDLDQLDSLQTMRATLKVSDVGHSTVSFDHDPAHYNREVRHDADSGRILRWESNEASIVKSNEAVNGVVHIIDNVLVAPGDFQSASLSSMSSLLSSSNPASIFFVKSISPMQNLILLSCSLVLIIVVCSILIRHCLILARGKKLADDEDEDHSASGPLTSATSNTTGSTSTTKSL